jgi:hypothetical protein
MFISRARAREPSALRSELYYGWNVLRAGRSERVASVATKAQVSLANCQETMGYKFLYQKCRLYRAVGKVSHLERLRSKPPEEEWIGEPDAGKLHVRFR